MSHIALAATDQLAVPCGVRQEPWNTASTTRDSEAEIRARSGPALVRQSSHTIIASCQTRGKIAVADGLLKYGIGAVSFCLKTACSLRVRLPLTTRH